MGFRHPDVIKLCQQYRTHTLSEVSAKLKDTPCSFCTHPLQNHTPANASTPAQEGNETFRKPLGAYENLTLRSSSLLPFSPVSSNCWELLAPQSLSDGFLALSVCKSKNADSLSLAVLSHPICQQDATVDEKGKESSPPPPAEEEGRGGATRKRARRTRSAAASVGVAAKQARRSRRLATKKARDEEKRVLNQLKGLKGVGRWLREVELNDGDTAEKNELTDQEMKEALKGTLGFMKQMDTPEGYQTFALPQVCCGCMY